jgi:hypothetical protein
MKTALFGGPGPDVYRRDAPEHRLESWRDEGVLIAPKAIDARFVPGQDWVP